MANAPTPAVTMVPAILRLAFAPVNQDFSEAIAVLVRLFSKVGLPSDVACLQPSATSQPTILIAALLPFVAGTTSDI